MIDVRYPHMRAEFLSELRATFFPEKVADRARIQRAFEYLVNFVYDDTSLSSDPTSLIGWVLLNREEVDIVREFVESLDRLLSSAANNLDIKNCESKPEWEVASAKAHEVLKLMS